MTSDLTIIGTLIPTTAVETVTRGDRNSSFSAPFGLPSFLDTTVINGGYLNGVYDTWCIRSDQSITSARPTNPGIYNVNVFSSYGTLPPNILLTGEQQPVVPATPDQYIDRLQKINWIFNYITEAANVSGGVYNYQGQTYTLGDVQVAIWKLLDNPIDAATLGIIGPYDATQAKADQIVSFAQAHGDFITAAGQDIGIILQPQDGSQITIIEVKTAGLGNFVFDDLNANGIQDTGELGIAGVLVTLQRADGTAIGTTTTDTNGNYQFVVLAGQYKVSFSQPTGFDAVSPRQVGTNGAVDSDGLISDVVTLAAGQIDNTIDSGFYKFVSIFGFVFVDANDNGVKDAGESAIAGTTITLTGVDGSGNTITSTATTLADGSYKFEGLRPGTYNLTETQPNGYLDGKDAVGSQGGTLGNDNFSTIILKSGDVGINNNFGELNPASISGFVYVDANNNGVKDSGETAIAGAVITLTGTDNLGNTLTTTATTQADGSYVFSTLRPGIYNLTETQPSGYLDGKDVVGSQGGTLGNDNISTITLGSGTNGINNNFGELNPASISGFVYVDANNNGVKDSGETAIAGTVITLTGTNDLGNIVTTTATTQADGSYVFSTLRPGTYNLTETQPANYLDGKDAVGSQGGTLGNDNISTITLGSGTTGINNNFGELNPASIAGFVYVDANNNGVKDSGETAIAGTTITLTGVDDLGNLISTTATTLADGSYTFTGLRPGSYDLTETQPNGYLDGKDAVGSQGGTLGNDNFSSIILKSGDVGVNNNFGELNPASIAGFVYVDANNNGVKDSGETAIAGALITLTGTDDLGNTVTTTATTQADGSYIFSALRPGTYNLTETQPSGYLDGKDAVGSQGGTLGNDNISTITLASGTTGINNNFGELNPASIAGFVYVDADNDGVFDASEAAIAGAVITLTGTNDLGSTITTTATTQADGSYSFNTLRPGTYKLTETQPANYLDGKDAVGSQGGTLGNDNISTITLASGTNGVNNNFGELIPASLAGFVYVDANNDGIKGLAETAIGGVLITLTGTNDLGNAVTVTATTQADGSYAFNNLRPGTYSLTETQPSGFTDGKDTVGSQGGTLANDNFSAIALTSGTVGINNNFGERIIIPDTFTGDLSITKTNGLTTVVPGQSLTYTIVARNAGPSTATNALVSDIIPTTLTNVTWTSVASGGATDNQLSGTGSINDYVTLVSGSSITYTVTGTVATNVGSTGAVATFDLSGNSALDGTDGNIRTFTAGGISVKASAFSRNDANGAWTQAFLGAYGGGLGVTDSSEGDGTNTHRVDNIGGQDNYVLFEFSDSVVIDRAYLQYVLNDSDASIWIGNFNNPFNNHLTLSDSLLTSFGFKEVNDTTLTSDRWADINAGNYVGNTLVIAASAVDTTPEDEFKIRYLDVFKPAVTSLTNTATITGATGFTDTNPNNNSATDTDAIVNPQGDLSITKTNGLTTVVPGQSLTYTIVVRNTGPSTAINALVSDIIPTTLTNVSWTSVASGGATDNQTSGTGSINDYVTLVSGSNITYTVNGTVAANAISTGTVTTFDLAGNSALDGTDGNIRTFTSNGISVKASAFSRTDSTGAWASAYLGAYGGGLGVTDSSEGDGTNTHRVDNIGGRDNYVLFEFSESVVIDRAYLAYVLNDSDASIWIGNFNNPFNNHLTLSDSLLTSFGFKEVNDTTLTSDRWADFNAGNYVGNTLVIAASDVDTTPEDQFKIRYLDVFKPVSTSLINTATVTAPTGFVDTNPNNNSATDTDAIVNAQGDLSITKTDGLTTVVPGQSLTYTIVVRNTGTSTAANALVSDVIPTTLTNVTWTSVAAGGATDNQLSGTGSINDYVTLVGGSTITYTVNAIVSSNSIGATNVSNTATVTAPTGFVDTNSSNNSATDIDTLRASTGARTPGFWQNTSWQKFWDGIQGNEPAQAGTTNFPGSDLFFAPYTNSAQAGKVLDPLTGTYKTGVLVGDFNRNGKTDTGEDTLFYTTSQALTLLSPNSSPSGDKRYAIGRDVVATWLNYLAGNPIDLANTTAKDVRDYIGDAVDWLQATSNAYGNVFSVGSAVSSSSAAWNSTTFLADTASGSTIHSVLDGYNNGSNIYATGNFYGGN